MSLKILYNCVFSMFHVRRNGITSRANLYHGANEDYKSRLCMEVHGIELSNISPGSRESNEEMKKCRVRSNIMSKKQRINNVMFSS